MEDRQPVYILNRAVKPSSPASVGDLMEENGAPTAWAMGVRHCLASAHLPEEATLVGCEAFADWSVLPQLLREFQRVGITPLLLTRGTFPAPEEVIVDALLALTKHGTFKILFVADHTTACEPHAQLFSGALHAAREALLITPEILFLTESEGKRDQAQQRFASPLFYNEELSQASIIYPRAASSLEHYLDKTAYDLASHRVRQAPDSVGPLAEISEDLQIEKQQQEEFGFYFSSLVIETTHLCNARCSHCYTSCGPDSPRTRLKPEHLIPVLQSAASIKNLRRKLHVGGGEATIYWNELIVTLSAAKELGFVNSIVTNGFWGESRAQANRKAAELAEAGVTKIEFSVDAMHQEFVTPTVMSNVIRACRDNGIHVVLRICTTKSRPAGKTLSLLTYEDCERITIGISKVTPVGRANTDIDATDLWIRAGIPIGACKSFLNLTVAPDGGVYPCCAGSELCSSLSLGNIFHRELAEIVRSARANLFVRTLVHAGPSYFAQLIKDAHLEERLLSGYSTYCHLCNQICSDSVLVDAVTEGLRKKARKQLSERLLRGFGGSRAVEKV